MILRSMKDENAKIRQYLLGNLPQKESEELDLKIIAGEDFEEKLLLAEHELVEDYLEGAMSAKEKQLFRNNFFVGEERKKLLQDILLLKRYAKNRLDGESSKVEIGKTPVGGISGTLKNLFSPRLRPLSAVFALLIIGILVFGIWQIFLAGSSPLENEYAALNRKDFSSTAEFTGFSNVSLVPGVFRDANSAGKLNAEKLTESVFFRLALPFEVENETIFKSELLKDGKTVFTQNQIGVYRNAAGGGEARLLLPKSILTKGQYQIKLENTSNKNSSVAYGFEVE